VQDGEKGDLPAEIFFITGKALQGLGDSLKEKRVERLFVPERKIVELFGNGKDDMKVVYG
jgi:hypothetical protein